nr:NPCBM/NEW2 domain-containing protein [Zavarzinella formosa]
MSNRLRFLLPAVGLFLMVALTARADEADDVKEKLAQAKRVYDNELRDFKKAVADLFDKREETIRKSGDKKALDELKAQRKGFDDLGEAPPTLPMKVKTELATARTVLDKAYQTAIKDCIRLKLDSDAEKVEKERDQFLLASACLVGKRTYLTTLKPFDIKTWNNVFEKDSSKYKMDGRAIPHSIFMHPDTNLPAGVSYTLPVKVSVFRTSIGVPYHEDKQPDPHSALTFEVLLDGKSIWKSEPVTKMDTFQTVTLKVDKAKTLTLRAYCAGSGGGAHCVWFAPVLIE